MMAAAGLKRAVQTSTSSSYTAPPVGVSEPNIQAGIPRRDPSLQSDHDYIRAQSDYI
jgi:hypothetical protein